MVAAGLGERPVGELARRAQRPAPVEAGVDKHRDQPVDRARVGVDVVRGIERGPRLLRLGAARPEHVDESHAGSLTNPAAVGAHPNGALDEHQMEERKPRSRRLLVTTKTLENAIAAPASIGLSRPVAARGRAATL